MIFFAHIFLSIMYYSQIITPVSLNENILPFFIMNDKIYLNQKELKIDL